MPQSLFLLALILIPAIGFGDWPVITRMSGNPTAAWTNVILMSVTTALMLVYYGLWSRELWTDPLTLKQGVGITGAAVLNSVALVLFGLLIQRYPQYVPVAQALMPMASLFGAWKFLGQQVSVGQVVCMGMACVFVGLSGYFTPPPQ